MVRVLDFCGDVYIQVMHKDNTREFNYSEKVSKEEAMNVVQDLKRAFNVICEKKEINNDEVNEGESEPNEPVTYNPITNIITIDTDKVKDPGIVYTIDGKRSIPEYIDTPKKGQMHVRSVKPDYKCNIVQKGGA